jgi:hypothetical protein
VEGGLAKEVDLADALLEDSLQRLDRAIAWRSAEEAGSSEQLPAAAGGQTIGARVARRKSVASTAVQLLAAVQFQEGAARAEFMEGRRSGTDRLIVMQHGVALEAQPMQVASAELSPAVQTQRFFEQMLHADDASLADQPVEELPLSLSECAALAKVPVRTMLLSWVNWHLERLGSSGGPRAAFHRRAADLGDSLADGECLAALLVSLRRSGALVNEAASAEAASDVRFARLSSERDPRARVDLVAQELQFVLPQVSGLVSGSAIARGDEQLLQLCVSFLFAEYGVQPRSEFATSRAALQALHRYVIECD